MKETTLDRDWDLEERLPLNFANTLENQASALPMERFNSYFDLVDWSWAAGGLTEDKVRYLLDEAVNHLAEVSVVISTSLAFSM